MPPQFHYVVRIAPDDPIWQRLDTLERLVRGVLHTEHGEQIEMAEIDDDLAAMKTAITGVGDSVVNAAARIEAKLAAAGVPAEALQAILDDTSALTDIGTQINALAADTPAPTPAPEPVPAPAVDEPVADTPVDSTPA